jgi:hypothetical protein
MTSNKTTTKDPELGLNKLFTTTTSNKTTTKDPELGLSKFVTSNNNNSVNLCCILRGAGSCSLNLLKWLGWGLLFIGYGLLYIVPSAMEIWPLVVYHDNFPKVELTLIIHSSLLMIFTAAVGIKSAIDYRWIGKRHYYGEKYKDPCCNCEEAWGCGETNYFLSSGSFFVKLIPWVLCNIIATGVFGDQLVQHYSAGIVIMSLLPLPLFGIFMVIGCAIMNPINKYRLKQLNKN